MNIKPNGRFSMSKHGKFIRSLISDEKNWGKFTRTQIGDMAQDSCGYQVTPEMVRVILRSEASTDFSVHENIARQWEDNGDFDRAKHEAEKRGINPKAWKDMWIKDEETSIRVVNDVSGENLEELIANSLEKLRSYSPKIPTIKRKKITDPHLLVIDPADIHVGKLAVSSETGHTYNLNIAKQRCIEGVNGLLEQAQGFPIEKIMFVIGNDALHIDVPKRTTTSGTPQDTDGQWHEMFGAAEDMYIEVIELLMQVADVDVVYNPSNHDYASGYYLARVIQAYFRNSKNVTFNVSLRHRKYYTYGQNLIATTHGDGAKHTDMPMLMAAEAKDWSNTSRRYIYLHHLHHKKRVKWQDAGDMPGVSYQILRSPSAPDGWHDRNGYTGSPMAVEGFIHHKENGQIASLTHYFV